jgi:hypothetical protein
MRLGQLARKLEVRPIEVVEFLATKNIHIDTGTNTKVAAAHATLALQHFAPHVHLEDMPETDIQGVELPDPGPPAPVEEVRASIEEAVVPPDSTVQQDPERIEVIKAPKVELSGLKVLGKIELPEIKKKSDEPIAEDNTAEPPKELKREKRNSNHKTQPRPAKNPIAKQREEEELEAKKKRDEALRLQKEKRTQNYLKKVKNQQPTKAARFMREETEEMSTAQLQEPPKTWWGKFLKWLTT